MLSFLSSPFIAVFLFLPIVAILIGMVLFKYKYIAIILSFLLPLLLFVDKSGQFDMRTFKINIDAWLIYGAAYTVLSFLASFLLAKFIRKKSFH
ncbi:hypothetical protein ACFDTO_27030 [Microbacteriaceae bacterium 4G12]